jgi:hypothetical protein
MKGRGWLSGFAKAGRAAASSAAKYGALAAKSAAKYGKAAMKAAPGLLAKGVSAAGTALDLADQTLDAVDAGRSLYHGIKDDFSKIDRGDLRGYLRAARKTARIPRASEEDEEDEPQEIVGEGRPHYYGRRSYGRGMFLR